MRRKSKTSQLLMQYKLSRQEFAKLEKSAEGSSDSDEERSERLDEMKQEEAESGKKIEKENYRNSPRLNRAITAHNLSFGSPKLEIRRMHLAEKQDIKLQVKQKTINFHRRVKSPGSPSLKIPNFAKVAGDKNTSKFENANRRIAQNTQAN